MKSKTTATLLAFFLGGLGIHKFYLGRTTQGVFYFLFFWTLIPAILAFVDFLVLLSTSEASFDSNYNQKTY